MGDPRQTRFLALGRATVLDALAVFGLSLARATDMGTVRAIVQRTLPQLSRGGRNQVCDAELPVELPAVVAAAKMV